MTGTAVTGEAQRLDALASVTREYAKYSRSAFGLALVVAGAWVIAAHVVAWRIASRAGEVMRYLGPLVWLAALVLARARYQRLGAVVQEEFWATSRRRAALAFLYAGAVIELCDEITRPRPFALVAVAALVALPMLAVVVSRGAADALATVLVLGPGIRAGGPSLPSWWFPVVTGLVFSLLGVWQHSRHVALERRLAALRSSAP